MKRTTRSRQSVSRFCRVPRRGGLKPSVQASSTQPHSQPHSETLEGLSADFGFAASQGRTDAPKATGPVAAWPRVPKQAPIQSWSRVMRLPRRKVAAKLRCSQRTGWSDFEGASCSRARFPELGHDVAGRGECSLVRGRPLTVRKRPAGAYEAHTRRGYNRRLEGPHGSAIV